MSMFLGAKSLMPYFCSHCGKVISSRAAMVQTGKKVFHSGCYNKLNKGKKS
jgi:hypothetical protein